MEVELGGSEGIHDGVEDAELSGSEGSDHDATGSQALRAEVPHASLGRNVVEARHNAACASGSRLVDLGEESVCRVGDDGGSDTGNDTGAEGHRDVAAGGHLVGGLSDGLVDLLGCEALDCELGHGVGDLLEEDGAKAGVEAADDAVLGHELSHGCGHGGGKRGLRDEADAGGFEGAQEDVGDDLGSGGGGQVDVVALLPGLLGAQGLGGLGLEELHASELEPALHEVPEDSGGEAREEGGGSLLCHHLPHPTDQATLVLERIQLDAGLHLEEQQRKEGGTSAAVTAMPGKGQGITPRSLHRHLLLHNHLEHNRMCALH